MFVANWVDIIQVVSTTPIFTITIIHSFYYSTSEKVETVVLN